MGEAFKALPKSSLDHKRGCRESGKKNPRQASVPHSRRACGATCRLAGTPTRLPSRARSEGVQRSRGSTGSSLRVAGGSEDPSSVPAAEVTPLLWPGSSPTLTGPVASPSHS